MQRGIMWILAILVAGLALVAGCINVDVPKGPYVVGGFSEPKEPSPKDREKVQNMDKTALENEVLRLAAENDRLRQEIGQLERENKKLDQEKDDLEDRVDRLEDQVKDLRKR